MANELWKPVKGYEGFYEVLNDETHAGNFEKAKS